MVTRLCRFAKNHQIGHLRWVMGEFYDIQSVFQISLVVHWLRIHLPINARDMGSIPGPGRSSMPQSKCYNGWSPRTHVPQQEESPQWTLSTATRESLFAATKTQRSQKKKKRVYLNEVVLKKRIIAGPQTRKVKSELWRVGPGIFFLKLPAHPKV